MWSRFFAFMVSAVIEFFVYTFIREFVGPTFVSPKLN